MPELPQLSPGITLFEAPRRAIGPLHALVLDHLLGVGGEAVWIDAHGHASSIYLADVAPAARVLDRIRVARGFTPYQHRALVDDAADAIDEDTKLLVAPAVDWLYREEDVQGTEPQQLLLGTLARLARYARESELPVLLTRVGDDDLAAPVEQVADHRLSVTRTRFGPRFEGDDFETLLYADAGETMQSTLAFWARILRARQPTHEGAASQPEPATEVRP
jgi:hypothetical protein